MAAQCPAIQAAVPSSSRSGVPDAVATGSAGRAGWRPRQGVAVDLPGGAGGQGVDDGDTRDEGGRHRRPQLLGRGLGVEARVGGDVADEQPVARLGALDRSGGSADPGEAEQGAVDLTELDPSTTDLDLVVGTPLEDQTHAVEADDVAAAVGALPAQARHRGVHRGILLGVEVAGQTHAPDDQLARLSIGNALALRVDDGEVPAVEREADAHGGLAVELGTAGDDGGLGGAVGVPDLAGVGGQARADLGRARLAAEDEQADVGEGVGRPEGDEGRHGETMVMSLATSHGPRSMPERTRERGAGTRQAPYRQASHISSQLASNATDRPAMTRSPGRSGAAGGTSATRRRRRRRRCGG
jgi:hypothetical protein